MRRCARSESPDAIDGRALAAAFPPVNPSTWNVVKIGVRPITIGLPEASTVRGEGAAPAMISPKLAARTLFKTPFVTAIAVVSLALGIGANAAIFSLFDQMLLRPLPVAQPDQLVNLAAPGPKPGSQSCNQAGDCETVFSYPMFRDLERVQQVFTGISAHRIFGANLAFKGETLNGEGVLVSGSYFPVLGVQPALGRLLASGDDRTVGESHVVVLGYEYWRMRFGERADVVNQALVVNGEPMTIVGVAPQGFAGTTLGGQPQVYVPITMREIMERFMSQPGRPSTFENRRSYWVYLFGRLKPGVSVEQARAALNVPYRGIINDVEAPLQKGMSDKTLQRFRERTVTLEADARGQSNLHREAGKPLMLLLSVTGLVLLIACANVANLLLAKAATRAGEMAVRLSIGASRWQLVAQLLTESCLLATFGGLAGLLVARWTLDLVISLMPSQAASTIHGGLDTSVLLFSGAITLGTGLLFGLFPALHSTRPDLASTLKGQAGQPSGARAAAWFRTSLATAQVALSMTLLVAAGLFVKSLFNVSRVDLGLNIDHLVMFSISPELNGYTPERSRALFERLEDGLSAVPGASGVTAGMVPLLGDSNWNNSVAVEGFQAGPDTDTTASVNEIAPAYFRTLGVPLASGREFTRTDALGTAKVALVNEAFAKKFNLGRNVVGKRMSTDSAPGAKLDVEIVGLVPNTKYSEVKAKIPPQFFLPYRQDKSLGFLTFYVRTSLDAEQALGVIRKVVSQADPNLPLENLRTMTEQARQSVFVDRIISTLSSAFAVLATLLAAIGLYGVLAYTVAQRTREIGLRMALGAGPQNVRRMIMRQVAWMTLVGGAVGLAAALGLGLAAQTMLFELTGYDPTVFAASAVVLTLTALCAGFIPAMRASRIDPMEALRYE
jgi:predicted permease